MSIANRRAAHVGVSLLLAFAGNGATMTAQAPKMLDVQFSLVTPENRPIGGAPVRLVLGEIAGWQAANAGVRFVTDAKGQHTFSLPGSYSERRRKMPTNFWTNLMSRAQATQHFTVAAELPYARRSWLYVADVDHFSDGTTAQMDAMRVFGADNSCVFQVPVAFSDGLYSLPGLPGTLRVPGHGVNRFSARPDVSGARWTLIVEFVRYPEPVVR